MINIQYLRKILLFSLLIANISISFEQTLYAPKIESPNAAALGSFGSVPINLFTGTPDINIPLYTMNYGNISVPVNLRYNSAAVKPGQMPGWVGSGWDLESIGSISRQVRGAVDEFYIDGSTGNSVGPNVSFYFPYPGQAVTPGSDYANQSNWNSHSQLVFDFTQQPNIAGIDVEADEFSFNVMGHSGKFYYSGSTKGWQVASDENIKVEVLGFVDPTTIRNAISQYTFSGSVVTSVNQSRMFSGFILTVPDGTKYYFGDINNSGYADGIEFSSKFMQHDPLGNGNSTPEFVANTWLLRKIVDVNNNYINFSYQRKYATCNLDIGFFELNASCSQSSSTWDAFLWGSWFGAPMIGSSATYSTDYVNTNDHFGVFQWPMYLTTISSPNENISFSFSDASCYRYTNNQVYWVDQTNTTNGAFYADNMLINLNSQYIQWEKLDKIVVKDNPSSVGLYSTTPKTIKQFAFTYANTSSQRLRLGSLQLLDNQSPGNIVGQYQFSYNSDFITQNSGLIADGNYTDHWGYFNNIDISNARFSDIYTRKQPNSLVLTTELLNKIVYPTGGYSNLTWQPNDYTSVVTLDRQSLIPFQSAVSTLTGSGGGLRISEIKNCLSDGTVITDKKYYYKKNYSAGSDPNSLASSGVLNGTPQYYFSLVNRTGILGYTINNYQAASLFGTQNYSYAGNGSPVGYDEVCEVNLDASYTKTYFTNYGNDYNNVTHFDQIPTGYLGWLPGYDTYFPMSSLELERGKPVSVLQYKADNTLLQSEVFTYRNDAGRFNSSINLIDLNASFGASSCNDALVLASAHSVFNYSYYPTAKTVTTYDQNGANPVSVTEHYTAYNANNLLQAKNTLNSKGEIVNTTYAYPTDYPSTTPYPSMSGVHILNPVISTAVTTIPLGSSTTPLTTITKNYSQPYTGIFVPQNLQVQVGSNPIETREQINAFDSKGHPLEIQKPNGAKEVYLWGCNSQFILAKIVGSDYSTASGLVNATILNEAGMGTGSGSISDGDIRKELDKLRTGLPDALVTTYTYSVGVGMTSETDPAGRTTYYDYDLFNRLIDIRDQDNNIIKRFCYNYAGQPDNCANVGIGNTVKTGTFTSTNSCPSGTSPATVSYTIPANTYYAADQATADAMATTALNSQGQALANSTPCQAAITGTNSTGVAWNGTMTNTSTNVSYTFSIYPGYSLTSVTALPIGTYNISITPYTTQSSPVNLTVNGITYSGTTFSLTNISINNGTDIKLANQTGSGPCSVVMSSGYSSPTNGLSSNGTSVSGYLVFYSTSTTMSPGYSYTIGTISGTCRPSATRTFTTTSSGRTWTVTVAASGLISVQMAYGSSSVSPGTTVNLTISYNL